MSDDADGISGMSLEDLRLELHRVKSRRGNDIRRVSEAFKSASGRHTYEEELELLIKYHEEQDFQRLKTSELSRMEALVLVDMIHHESRSKRNELEFLACSLLGLDFTNDQRNEMKFAKQQAERDPKLYSAAAAKVRSRLQASEPVNTKYPMSVRTWLGKS